MMAVEYFVGDVIYTEDALQTGNSQPRRDAKAFYPTVQIKQNLMSYFRIFCLMSLNHG